MSSSPSAASPAAWSLWCDWCRSLDADPYAPDADVVEQFFQALPTAPATERRRRQGLQRVLPEADLGLHTTRRTERSSPAWRRGGRWMGWDDTVNRICAGGWPEGLHGRRDAWAVLLVGRVGLTRRQAVILTPDEVRFDHQQVRVAGVTLTPKDSPQVCPCCVVVRWLEIVDAHIRWGRGRVREILHAAAPLASEHVCATLGPVLAERPNWRQAAWLLPAIDRYGWMSLEDFHDGTGPLSTRALSALLAARQADGPPQRPDSHEKTLEQQLAAEQAAARCLEPNPWDDADDDELYDQLDATVNAADATLRRLAEALSKAGF